MKPLVASWALALLLAVGCSRGPQTHQVSGRVQLKPGMPVHVGMIEFIPREPGPSARGQIGPGGVYRLCTFGDGDGAQAGEYTVVISQPQLFSGLRRAAPQEHTDEQHDGVEERTGVVPDRFSRPRESGLSVVVEARDNTLDFVLIETDE